MIIHVMGQRINPNRTIAKYVPDFHPKSNPFMAIYFKRGQIRELYVLNLENLEV
jgi:hypothetical protein